MTVTDTGVARARGLPVAGNLPALLHNPMGFLQGVRDLGDVVLIKLGPMPVYVINDPDLIHSVLVTHNDDFTRGRFFDKLALMIGNGLAASSGELHRRQRRLILPAFRHDRLQIYSTVMVEEIQAMLDAWRPGRELELFSELFGLAAGIAARALFGESLDPPTAETFRAGATVFLTGFIRRVVIPGEMLGRIPTAGNRRFERARKDLREILVEVVEEYVASGRQDETLLSTLVAARDEDGRPMSRQQLYDESVTMLLAASETQTTTLAWLFYELARHPEVERRLRGELAEVLDGRPPSFEDLPRLPYLRNVLHEGLRRHHPIWNLMRRPIRPVDLGGVSLPANVEVLMSLTALHRDARFYPRPYEFDPDRWDGGKPDHITYLPFAAGIHRCVGEHYALTLMPLVIAGVIQNWRLEQAPGSRPREIIGGTLRPDRMPMIPRRIS